MNRETRPSAARDGESPCEFRSFVFLLGAQGVRPLPHALYVALARGDAACPELAGHSLRLADLHVRLEGSQPVEVVREWYGWVRFDAAGRFDPVAYLSEPERGNVDPTALAGPGELAAMHEDVFGVKLQARPDRSGLVGQGPRFGRPA